MHQLCFEVCSTALNYYVINTSDKTVEKSATLTLKGRIPELKKEECADLLRTHQLLDFSGNVSLSVSGSKVTLVPQIIFGESNAKEIFELCFGNSDDLIEHNRFFEQTLVVVYEIEEWIKRFFVVRYPRVVIQHQTTHLLRGIFQKNSYEPRLHLSVEDNFCTLILISKSEIIFFNTFDFQSTEDIFYYTMHAWNGSISAEKKKHFCWHSDAELDENFEAIKGLLEKHFTPKECIFEQISRIKHQLLCV